MKELQEFVTPINNYNFRESTEWSNFWIDCANAACGGGRILLIGDSTARMIRSTLSRELSCPVDLCASSSNLFDSLFINQINCFFRESLYRYECIIIQMGVHGKFQTDSDVQFEADAERYRQNILGLFQYLRQTTDKVIIETVFLSVKPKTKILKYMSDIGIFKYIRWMVNDVPDVKKNIFQQKKNEIIRSLEGRLRVLDICTLMQKHRYKKYDHIHYERDAYKTIVGYMIDAINSVY